MSKTTKITLAILKVVVILSLIFAVISTVFFAVFKLSINKANDNNSVPTVFGNQWVTVTSDKFNDIVPKGSLVILEEVDTTKLTGTEVLLYETGDTTVDNVVYGIFSLGRTIKNPSSADNETETVLVQNVISQDSIEVPLSSVKSQAVYQIGYIGGFVSQVASDLGMLKFVILPIAIFVVLLLVYFISIIVAKSRIDDDYDDEKVSDKTSEFGTNSYKKENNLRKFNSYNHNNEDSEDTYNDDDNDNYQDEYSDRLVRLKDRYIDNDTEEKLDLKFEKKVPQITQEVIHFDEADCENTDENTNIIDQDFPKFDVVDDNLSDKNHTNKFEKYEEEINIDTDKMLSEILNNTDINTSTDSDYDDASAHVDEFLRSLNLDTQTIEQEYMAHTTLEFDLDKINENILDENKDIIYGKQQTSQELLDNILIDLKSDALDFRFDSLKSDSVEIEESRKGDGFIIKTPKYKANIKVEIDKNN